MACRADRQRRSRRGVRCRGVVLITVMVVIGIVAISAASLLYRVNSEVIAASTAQRGEQASAAAYSGLQRAIALLQAHRNDPDIWYDNPELFQDQLVFEDGDERWYFTVYAPPVDENTLGDESTWRFGVSDTASRLNVNVASEESLLRLPNMTPELVDALLDYRDRDSNPRPQGVEQEYYSELARPYLIKNGPFATVEELLLVRGFTPRLLFGAEVRGGEADGESEALFTEMPLARLLTTHGFEPDVDAQGQRRFDLNGNLNGLESLGLSEDVVKFIRIYRSEGNRFAHPSELLGMEYTVQQTVEEGGDDDRGGRGGRRGPRQRRGGRSAGDDVPRQAGEVLRADLSAEELEILMGRTTAQSAARRRRLLGRVNINTASAAVLAAIPGLDEDLADHIVSVRSGLDPQSRTTVAWLYNEGLVDEPTFRAVAPRLTTQSYQFHVRVLGYGLPSGRYRVYEAVIDLAGERPQVRYLRDRTKLGLPMPIAEAGVN